MSHRPDVDSFAAGFTAALDGTADRPPRMPRIVLYVIVALLLVLAAVVTFVPSTAGAARDGHRVYAFPASELAAARDCYRAEREARGIPGDRAAYIVWWNAHAGTSERADWSASYRRCQSKHLTTSPWDYAHLVRVR